MQHAAEQCFQLRDHRDGPTLLVRRRQNAGPAVLYVHGATFPSALSVAWRIEGRSWMDDLHAHGFDAWAFDFVGYGGSDRYSAMTDPQEGAPLGRASQAASQIARVVEHICRETGRSRVSLVAHSWGTMPAGLYVTQGPERVDSLCLFGPIVQRQTQQPPDIGSMPAWRFVTLAEQRASFYDGLPEGHPPVLFEPELEEWGPAYLATDPEAYSHVPPAVKVPGGPFADSRAAWAGDLAYAPELLRVPTLLVRGEWDTICNDADAAWLLARIAHPVRRDAKLEKGTHRMHLERSREGLFRTVREFLKSLR